MLKHEKLLRFLHIFGTVWSFTAGMPAYNFLKDHEKTTWKIVVAIISSVLLSSLYIVIMPVYFIYNIKELIGDSQERAGLRLVVFFIQTVLKYICVVLISAGSWMHRQEFANLNKRLEDLDRIFAADDQITRKPTIQFWFRMTTKLTGVTLLYALHICKIMQQYYLNEPSVRWQFNTYFTILWTMTALVDGFPIYITSYAVKSYQILHGLLKMHLKQFDKQVKISREGAEKELMIKIRDLSNKYTKIEKVIHDTLNIWDIPILTHTVTTFVGNIVNFFLVYNTSFLGNPDWANFTIIYAIMFLLDTYSEFYVFDGIKYEKKEVQRTLQRFYGMRNELVTTEIEKFAFQMGVFQSDFRICGLFNIDHVFYFNSCSTGFQYFLTLVQFDIASSK